MSVEVLFHPITALNTLTARLILVLITILGSKCYWGAFLQVVTLKQRHEVVYPEVEVEVTEIEPR